MSASLEKKKGSAVSYMRDESIQFYSLRYSERKIKDGQIFYVSDNAHLVLVWKTKQKSKYIKTQFLINTNYRIKKMPQS